jgi:hypothetical protein
LRIFGTPLLRIGAAAAFFTLSVASLVGQTIRIDCGSYQSYTASDGTVWSADEYYAGGQQQYSSYNVSGTVDSPLYRTARSGYYGDFSYAIPVANGQYTVTLRFAEIQYWAVGQRVFNVAINGTAILTNFDLVANGAYFTALDKQFAVVVTNGVIQINVHGVVNAGLLNAIQIVPSGSTPPAGISVSVTPNPGTVSSGSSLQFKAGVTGTTNTAVTWTSSAGSITGGLLTAPVVSAPTALTVTATSVADPTKSASAQVTVTPGTTNPSPVQAIAIDCGSYQNYKGADGTVWLADAYYSGGQQLYSGYTVGGTADGGLYNTARTGYYGDFSYSIPVANGSYTVHLMFAEIQYWAIGQRVFNVTLNGAQVLNNFDVVAQGGYFAAISRQFPVSVSNGFIQLSLHGIVSTPILSAIQIVGGSSSVPPPVATPALSISTNSLTFSGVAGGSNPAAQVVNISNTGGGTLNWTASNTESWLIPSAASGSAPAALSIGVVNSGLSPGTYSDTITINAPGASNSPQMVAVTLNLTSNTAGNQHYVATSGSASGDGSIAHPWDLQTALSQPSSVHPGDTIWLRGGTYGNGSGVFYSSLVGTASEPIIVREYPGERAIINGWLQVGCCDQNPHPNQGAYVWFWGLEFASSVTDRTGLPSGQSTILDAVDTWAPGTKFINNIVHDSRVGISMWKEAVGSEAYGNIVYYNGFQASDRAHGHGFYVQNDVPTMSISNNLSFNNFDNGMQFYGTSAARVRNITADKNILFNNGIISAGPALADNLIFAWTTGLSGIQVTNNYSYFTPQMDGGYNELGWPGPNADVLVTNNYFMGGREPIAVTDWSSVTFENNTIYSEDNYESVLNTTGTTSGYAWDNNTYYGSELFLYNSNGTHSSGWPGLTQMDAHSSFSTGQPTGTWSFVLPNKYESGRANIVIYNWNLASSVAVDVSSAISPGTTYEVRDAENFFAAPVVSGVYTGKPINIPMTGLTVAAPNGSVPNVPVHTAPQFGAFVLLPVH